MIYNYIYRTTLVVSAFLAGFFFNNFVPEALLIFAQENPILTQTETNTEFDGSVIENPTENTANSIQNSSPELIPIIAKLNGTFSGSAPSFGDSIISLDVNFKDNTITEIKVIDCGCTLNTAIADYVINAANQVISSIIKSNSTKVDSIAGATYTSKAVKNAVYEAYTKAKKVMDEDLRVQLQLRNTNQEDNNSSIDETTISIDTTTTVEPDLINQLDFAPDTTELNPLLTNQNSQTIDLVAGSTWNGVSTPGYNNNSNKNNGQVDLVAGSTWNGSNTSNSNNSSSSYEYDAISGSTSNYDDDDHDDDDDDDHEYREYKLHSRDHDDDHDDDDEDDDDHDDDDDD